MSSVGEMSVGQKIGSPPLYLVTSTPEPRNPKLARDAATKLEESRAMLLACGQVETVQLLDIVLLQLRMQVRGVSEIDLKALCAELAAGRSGTQRHDGA